MRPSTAWRRESPRRQRVAVSKAFCELIRSVNQRVGSGAGGDMASTPRLGQKRERGLGRIEPRLALGDAVVHGRHPPTQGCYDSVHTATPSPLTIATVTLGDGGVSETCDRSRLPTRFLELRSSSTGGTSRPSSARRCGAQCKASEPPRLASSCHGGTVASTRIRHSSAYSRQLVPMSGQRAVSPHGVAPTHRVGADHLVPWRVSPPT